MRITKFSPRFIERCLEGDPAPGDALPCPRCDNLDTKYNDYKSLRRLGLIALPIGALAAFMWAFYPAVRILGPTVAILFFVFTLTSEPDYICRGCHFRWRVKDVQKWAPAIRHDEEFKRRRAGSI